MDNTQEKRESSSLPNHTWKARSHKQLPTDISMRGTPTLPAPKHHHPPPYTSIHFLSSTFRLPKKGIHALNSFLRKQTKKQKNTFLRVTISTRKLIECKWPRFIYIALEPEPRNSQYPSSEEKLRKPLFFLLPSKSNQMKCRHTLWSFLFWLRATRSLQCDGYNEMQPKRASSDPLSELSQLFLNNTPSSRIPVISLVIK